LIVEGSELRAPVALRTHTLVIGSGAGGAVVAHGLAMAGVDTIVVEEGGYYQARDMTQRDDQMLPALYRDRGQQQSSDGMINVLQGSCFGGSTVVNTADCEPTPEPVYEHWRRRYGLDLDARELADAQLRVFEMLGVRPIDASQVNRNNDIVLEGARKLGWRAGTFQNNRTHCIGSGYCLIGCAYDAKKGAHLNYLPRAVEAGATIYTDVRIERVVGSEGGGFRATGAVVARGPRTARLPFEVQAERVVLAAGAVHSAAILDASGFARERPALARNVSLQPQMSVAASMPDAVVAWRGIPQSAFCSEFDDHTPERGLGGFRFEAISGGLSQIAAGLRGFGHAHKETMLHAREGALALLLVPDEPSGTLRFTRGERGFRAHIEYRMTDEWVARLRRGLRATAEAFFAAGARSVRFGSEIFEPLGGARDLDRALAFPIRTGVTHFVSAHVQGSCRMGPDPNTSVVDLDHQLHGVPGLYVVDASIFPSSASTHTMIPVMTFADRAVRKMLARGV
jgi:choline dehydrogenase-like flavoprotein